MIPVAGSKYVPHGLTAHMKDSLLHGSFDLEVHMAVGVMTKVRVPLLWTVRMLLLLIEIATVMWSLVSIGDG